MSNNRIWRISLGLLAVPVVAIAVMTNGAAQSNHQMPDSGYMPTIPITVVMDSIVMPSAQILWDSVAVNVTIDGIQETKPETDEDWERLRRTAVTLAEAANALMIPGRAVTPKGQEEVDPSDGDLSTAAVEQLLVNERPAWIAHARALHEVAMQTIQVIDAHDVDGLSEVGGAIDAACESCHVQFWYPDQAAVQ